MSLPWCLNTAWMISSRPSARRFRRSLRRVCEAQEQVLQSIVRANANSEFGRVQNFGAIHTVAEFRRRVPPATWEDFAPAVRRIAAGEQGVLTSERVELLEPTSGTTCAEKLIPYTASLRWQFRRALATWIADLFHHRPTVRQGRAYWSISPVTTHERRTVGGVRVGFDDDTDYLGFWQRMAVRRLLAVPPAVSRLTDTESWRYCTLLFLLAADDLSLVSVWSPTFLTTLVGSLTQYKERLSRDLFDGTCRPTNAGPSEIERALAGLLRCSRERARQVDRILAAGDDLPAKLHRLWPKLALISCWTDASAAMFLPELKSLFPAVELQAKGLLATEACVSIPLVGRDGCALALDSHFFEFEPVANSMDDHADSDDWRLAGELAIGSRYRVVVTTGGGLYRYQLRDVIEVVGFEHECALVRFVGKADRVGDLVGEKLAEAFVDECLKRVCAKLQIAPAFALIVPVVEARPPHYRLYLASSIASDLEDSAAAVQKRLEEELAANPYYDHAVRIGQLGQLDVRQLASAEVARSAVDDWCTRRGTKLGAVKPTLFHPSPDWPEVLEPLVAGRQPSRAVAQPVL